MMKRFMSCHLGAASLRSFVRFLPAANAEGTTRIFGNNAFKRTSRFFSNSCPQASGVVSKGSAPPAKNTVHITIPIRAVYLAHRLDFWHVFRLVYPNCAITTQANGAIVQLGGNRKVFDSPTSTSTPLDPSLSFIVFFKYGAIVLYNVSLEEQAKCLRAAQADFPDVSQADLRSEYYAVSVRSPPLMSRPTVASVCQITSDSITIPSLSVNALRVISQVLAQTVALEHFESKVHAMLDAFRVINSKIEQTGDLHLENKNKLFKLIATNNSILTDVISQLKVLDRSDIAWKYGGHTEIMWDSLRDEFEIPERFKAVEFKVDLIQDNTKFFMEVLHNQKSDKLEWAIIILLIFEILLCGYDIFERYSLRQLKESISGAIAYAEMDSDDDGD